MRLSRRLVVLGIFIASTQSTQVYAEQIEQILSPDLNYISFGGAEQGGDSFVTGGPVLANAVQTPKSMTFILSVTLNVKLRVRDLGSFDVFLSDVAPDGQFYSSKILATISDSNLTRDFKRIRVDFADNVPVAANKKYYVGIRRHSGANCTVILGSTSDPVVVSRPEIIVSGYSYSKKRGQQSSNSGVYEMEVVMQ